MACHGIHCTTFVFSILVTNKTNQQDTRAGPDTSSQELEIGVEQQHRQPGHALLAVVSWATQWQDGSGLTVLLLVGDLSCGLRMNPNKRNARSLEGEGLLILASTAGTVVADTDESCCWHIKPNPMTQSCKRMTVLAGLVRVAKIAGLPHSPGTGGGPPLALVSE